jgi:hypothetical protein
MWWQTAITIWYALLALLVVLFFWGERLTISRTVTLILFVVTVLAGLYIFYGLSLLTPPPPPEPNL